MSGGQAVTIGQGSGVGSALVALKSRKIGTGATNRDLTGTQVIPASGSVVHARSITPASLVATFFPGTLTASGGAALTWVGTPYLVFTAGVSSSIDLTSYVSGGFNPATDVFINVSGNPGFMNSPSGAFVSSTGTQTEGTYTDYVIGISRNGGAPVSSPAITIVVTTADVNLTRRFESGGMRFLGAYQSNQNAPYPNTFFNFGKQQQQCVALYSGVYKLLHTEGDGSNKWNNVEGNHFGNGTTYNDVLAFDFNNLDAGVGVDQLFDGYGRNKNGQVVSSYSAVQEGGTSVWDSVNSKILTLPGFMRGYPAIGSPDQIRADPYQVMGANFYHVHIYDPVALTCVAGPSCAGNWPGEHWGGAYDAATQRVWIQTTTGGENNGLNWYNVNSQTFGAANFTNANVAALSIYSGLGRALVTHHWRQKVWNAAHELICWDGFRGNLTAVNLDTFDVRVIAYLGRLRAVSYPDGSTEPISTIEVGLTINQATDECYVTAQGVIYFENSSEQFDIARVNLNTGATRFIRYPNYGMQLSSIEWVPKASGGGNLVVFDTEDPRYTQKFMVYSDPPSGHKRSATLASTAQYEVRAIPNSNLCTTANIHVLNACRANAGLSLLTATGQPIPQGANKDGITWQHWEGQNWPPSNGANGYGHVPDPTTRSWFFRMGDVQTPAHNGVARFNIDSEDWSPEVVRTINHLELRYPNETTGIYRPPGPGEYAHIMRNWNGGCVAQHGYWTACVFGPRAQYFAHVSGQQPAPGDSGGTDDVICANINDGQWYGPNPIAVRPGWSNDVQDWVTTHPTNPALVYSYSYSTGLIHYFDSTVSITGSNTTPWTWVQLNSSAVPGLFRCSPSFDVENNEILLIGRDGGGGTKRAYTVNMTTGTVTAVTLTGSGVTGVDPTFYGGLTYCSASHKHYYINRLNAVLYSITRTNSTTFTCAALNLTGVPLAVNLWDYQLGGVLKRLCAMPDMGGLVMQITDNQPLYFIGTV